MLSFIQYNTEREKSPYKNVLVNDLLLDKYGQKMHKSKGNAIYADDLVKYFGVDAVRYFCLNEMPFAQDGTITWELMIERINSDLANVLGNLVNRTISMNNKYFGGEIKCPKVKEDVDQELVQLALDTPKRVEKKMDELRVGDAITEIFTLLKRCNKYIDETTPWTLAKEGNTERLGTVLYNLLESIRIAAIQLGAYLPETSEKILNALNTNQRDFASCEEFGMLEVGNKVVEKPEILFARIDAKEMLEKINAEAEAAKKAKEAAEVKVEKKEEITFDDFMKVELKVGEVLSCEKHPKADKLLVSQIDCGNGDVRQIVSGIAQHYTPEEMKGKKVVVVTNLKPAKLRGVESQGMILAGDTADKLSLVTADLPNGTVIH